MTDEISKKFKQENIPKLSPPPTPQFPQIITQKREEYLKWKNNGMLPFDRSSWASSWEEYLKWKNNGMLPFDRSSWASSWASPAGLELDWSWTRAGLKLDMNFRHGPEWTSASTLTWTQSYLKNKIYWAWGDWVRNRMNARRSNIFRLLIFATRFRLLKLLCVVL